ncbi:MAG: amidohydrolase family protein [Deltaproteobacteria bacterium]|nr:amidohydrolase family protein [Deltaproteobacteria bacterium]
MKCGKVAKIGKLKAKAAKKTLDANRRIVAPGFVDLHTHYDAQINWDPDCTMSSWHGMTSRKIFTGGLGRMIQTRGPLATALAARETAATKLS